MSDEQLNIAEQKIDEASTSIVCLTKKIHSSDNTQQDDKFLGCVINSEVMLQNLNLMIENSKDGVSVSSEDAISDGSISPTVANTSGEDVLDGSMADSVTNMAANPDSQLNDNLQLNNIILLNPGQGKVSSNLENNLLQGNISVIYRLIKHINWFTTIQYHTYKTGIHYGKMGAHYNFFIFSHLHKSTHVGDFIITSEEAIAKGIRRIIAVTGPEAEKAQQRIKALEASVNILKNLLESKSIDVKDILKSINDHDSDISKATISYWKKDELRSVLKVLKKNIDNAERAGKTEQTAQVLEDAKKLAIDHKGDPYLVATLDAGSNTKALDSALKQVRTISPETAAMFFSVDNKVNKIFCLCSVPQGSVQKGLKGGEWVQHVCPKMGGKGGGKPESAQASGSNPGALAEILNSAKNFAKLKLCGNQAPSQSSGNNTQGLTYVKGSVSSLIVLSVAGYSSDKKLTTSEGPALNYNLNGVQLSELPAVVFAIAPPHLKGNDNSLLQAQILQWLTLVESFYSEVYQYLPVDVQQKSSSKVPRTNFLNILNYINTYLSNFTFLVNDRLSIADIFVFGRLLPVVKFVLKPEEKRKLVNLMRWFNTVANQSEVQKVVGKIVL